MSQQMRASANHLFLTVIKSYTVWALTASFLIVAALISTAFFQHAEVTNPDAPQFEEGLGRAFQDFRSSFLSMYAPASSQALALAIELAPVATPAGAVRPSLSSAHTAFGGVAFLLHRFIFVCTAANFADIVDPAMHLHWMYMLYFWLLAFVVRWGVTIIMCMRSSYPRVACTTGLTLCWCHVCSFGILCGHAGFVLDCLRDGGVL